MPRGGSVGTGVGAGNEFLLVNVMMSGRPTGTSVTAANEREFELTGPAEGKLRNTSASASKLPAISRRSR